MKIAYDQYKYDEIRNLNVKLFTPDDGIVARYVIALHGFAGSMESAVIHALAVNLTRCKTAVFSFNYAGHGTDEQDTLFSLKRCLCDFQNVVSYAKQMYPEADWNGVFATSYGGFITLNAMDMIPENVRIVLRAPAVNMPTVFERIVNGTEGGMDEYERSGSVLLGYEHKLNVPYSFYRELCENDVFDQTFDREILLINGTADDVVLPQDTAAFCQRSPKIIHSEIEGAGHRMQQPAEIAELMQYACAHFLKNAGRRPPERKMYCAYVAEKDQRVCASCMYWGTERGYTVNCVSGDYAVFAHDSLCLYPDRFGEPIRTRFGCGFWTKACYDCAADYDFVYDADDWR